MAERGRRQLYKMRVSRHRESSLKIRAIFFRSESSHLLYQIDPSRIDLVEEFRNAPDGPYSAELELVVNRLRLMPIAERHIIICTQTEREWVLAQIPAERGSPITILEDQVFHDYRDATWEVFKRRWHTVTGQEIE